ncbi:MAG: PAS domain S-box protein [Oligoflexales bacterium]
MSALTMVIGVLAFGSSLGFQSFDIPNSPLLAMGPSAALGLFLLGLSLYLLFAKPNVSMGKRALGIGAATFVAGSGIMAVMQSYLPLNFGPIANIPFVMAFCFACSGTSLILLNTNTSFTKLLGHWLNILSWVTAYFILLGHLTDLFVDNEQLRISPFATVGLFLVTVGIFSARSDVGLGRIIASRGYGSCIARRILAAIFVLFPLFGWAQHVAVGLGYISRDFGITSLIFLRIVIFVPIVLGIARWLNSLQDEIASREQIFRQLIGGAQDYAIILLDAAGCIRTWNYGAERLSGYSENEIVGKPISILFPPDERKDNQLIAEIAEARSCGKFEKEALRVRKDGSTFWAQISIARLNNERGHFIGFANITHDITKRKVAEDEARRSEAKFRTLADSIPQMAWIADKCGSITWYNQRWFEYTGTKPGEMLGWNWKCLQHPDHIQRTITSFEHALRTGNPWQDTFPLKGRTGEWRWFLSRANPVRDEKGKIISWFGTNTDITDEREAQAEKEELVRELEAKTSLLETIFEQMPTAVIVGESPTGRLIYANKQLDKLWRHPVIPTQTIPDYANWVGFHEDGRRYEESEWPLARAIGKGEVVVNEDVEILRGDNSQGIIRLNAAPVKNAKGEIIAGVVICQDVTDVQKSQAELVRSKEAAEAANQAKSEFLANMSHEIRTPMNAVIGFSDLLLEENLSRQEQTEYVQRIRTAGAHLIRLIDDILDLSKVDAGYLKIEKLRFSVVDVINGVFDALRSAAESKGLDLKLVFSSPVPQVIYTDTARLRQILLNVIGNAVKFTERGHVHVRLKFHQKDKLRNDACLLIEVDDSGIGIPPDAQSRLFQLFGQADPSVTRKYGGTGLGLLLSRKLTHALGGELELVKSVPGEGSLFRLTIPTGDVSDVGLIEQPNTLPQCVKVGDKDKEPPQLTGTKILVAEDAPDNAMLMRIYLRTEGAEVDVATDGLEAVRMALKKEYDVILMDLQMPNLGGLEATRRLRSQSYRKPILALTAHALKNEALRSLEAGCDDHLTKPVDRKQLVDIIKRYLKTDAIKLPQRPTLDKAQ